MKKKILILLTLVVSFCFFINIKALECDYSVSDLNDPYFNEIHKVTFDDFDFSKGYVVANAEFYENITLYFQVSNNCPKKIYVYDFFIDKEIYAYNKEISETQLRSMLGKPTQKFDKLVFDSEIKVDWDSVNKVSCGNISKIPSKIPELTNYSMIIIQIAVPVILIIMGALDLFKGITAQKEDEIKKGQQLFIKRLVTAFLIFFIIVIVKLLVSVIADSVSTNNIVDCIDCFLNNKCSDFIN